MGDFKGKIHWFNQSKKFGYVVDGYGNEYFYHASGIKKGRQIVLQGFEAEDEVEFDLIDGEKGKYATNLVLIKEAPKVKKKKEDKKEEPKKDKPQGKGVMAIAIEKAMKEKEAKETATVEATVTSESPETVEQTPDTAEATEVKSE